MTLVTLPEKVCPVEVTITPMDYGHWSKPILGGAATRTDRAGSRHKIDVTLPPIKNGDLGKVVTARLSDAMSQGLRFRWQQPGILPDAFGAPVVDGAATQRGMTLQMRGLRVGAQIDEGLYFSFMKDGRSYLHRAAETRTVPSNGVLALRIWPMLRTGATDGLTVNFHSPVIDGLIESELDWRHKLAALTEISFTLEEIY